MPENTSVPDVHPHALLPSDSLELHHSPYIDSFALSVLVRGLEVGLTLARLPVVAVGSVAVWGLSHMQKAEQER